uniref:hypothetical protein n=1 Tax=Acinetobacter pittii TaxID=48296 RepID=UPI00168D8D48
GHCVLAAPINDCGTIIPVVRKRFGATDIWNCDFAKSNLSITQKVILQKKALKFRFEDAQRAGRLILWAIKRLSPEPHVDIDAYNEKMKNLVQDVSPTETETAVVEKTIVETQTVEPEVVETVTQSQMPDESISNVVTEKALGKRKAEDIDVRKPEQKAFSVTTLEIDSSGI